MSHSKRYKEAQKLIDATKVYSMEEAIALLKKTATAKYDEAVEFHVRLGVDPSKSDQQVRSTIRFPHGTGKTKRVAAFVESEKEAEAKSAGADVFGAEELVNKIAETGVINFDVAVSTPLMMPKLAKLAKILGPRGLMPNPKTDTLGVNIGKIIEEQKAGKASFKSDTTGNVHQAFGRASFSPEQLQENLQALIDTLKRAKPSSSKGIYFQRATIAASVGPGIRIEIPA